MLSVGRERCSCSVSLSDVEGSKAVVPKIDSNLDAVKEERRKYHEANGDKINERTRPRRAAATEEEKEEQKAKSRAYL